MRKWRSSQSKVFWATALAALSGAASFGIAGASLAAPALPPNTARMDPLNLNLLEQKLFQRVYGQDPIQKRLQRLELLLYGATQEGSPLERVERLRETMLRRDQAAKPEKDRPAAGHANQIAQLQALESKILKKTYNGESLDKRLARLEAKVFGQPSPSMVPADRLQRLAKIVGVPDAAQISELNSPRAPRIMMVPFGMGQNGPLDLSPDDDINQQMNDMLRQLNRNMWGPNRQPALPVNPRTPNGAPFYPVAPKAPTTSPGLPPYLDPNSI